MKQKITYLIFLFLGAICEILLVSCKTIIDPIQVGTFVYVNKLSFPIKLKITNTYTYNKVSTEYEVASGDSLSFTDYGDVIAVPFNAVNALGDLVTLNFGNGKCTKYNRDDGIGVFKFSQYENYTAKLRDEKYFTLRYFINEKDFSVAQNCN
jgi:hypothetical protein